MHENKIQRQNVFILQTHWGMIVVGCALYLLTKLVFFKCFLKNVRRKLRANNFVSTLKMKCVDATTMHKSNMSLKDVGAYVCKWPGIGSMASKWGLR